MTAKTADAFVASIQGFEGLSIALQTDLLAYYLTHHGGAPAVSAASLASLREALHLMPHSRMSQYLSEQTSRKAARVRYVKKQKGYVLERAYSQSLEQAHLGRPSAVTIASSLRSTLSAIGDPVVRTYLEEALACFEHNLLRSSMIMTWCVAYGLFRSWLFRNHLGAFNAVAAAWKAPLTIATLDDFQDLTEGTVLDTARRIKVITKEQHKTLKALLDLRNSYAHLNAKPIKAATAESFIETVLDEVVPTYG